MRVDFDGLRLFKTLVTFRRFHFLDIVIALSETGDFKSAVIIGGKHRAIVPAFGPAFKDVALRRRVFPFIPADDAEGIGEQSFFFVTIDAKLGAGKGLMGVAVGFDTGNFIGEHHGGVLRRCAPSPGFGIVAIGEHHGVVVAFTADDGVFVEDAVIGHGDGVIGADAFSAVHF